jgi:hypothetical protein
VFSTYILGPILALLPRHWRERVFPLPPGPAAGAAVLSGILESVLALAALVAWYSIYVTLAADAISHSSLPGGGSPTVGLFAYIWFWLNPITWALAYFGLEGVARSLAALTSGEVYGILPLFFLEYAIRSARRRGTKPDLPLIGDEVLPGGSSCDIKIASCRVKSEWKYPFTIRYAGEYFQVVASAEMGLGPRPYVYSLRRLPHGEVASGLKDYHPDNVLGARLPGGVDKSSVCV